MGGNFFAISSHCISNIGWLYRLRSSNPATIFSMARRENRIIRAMSVVYMPFSLIAIKKCCSAAQTHVVMDTLLAINS